MCRPDVRSSSAAWWSAAASAPWVPAGSASWSRTASCATPVEYAGALPDLFREGQGVVATGAFQPGGLFIARQILAKHDERYMPKALSDSLKAQGEWRGDGKAPAYAGGGAAL